MCRLRRTFQGSSLLPLLSGDGDGWRDWALCQYRDSGHSYDPPVHVTMLRHDRWKLVVHHGAHRRAPVSGLVSCTTSSRIRRSS